MISIGHFGTPRPALGDLVPRGRLLGLTAAQYVENNAVHNVRDHGARGDGVTDDTAAFLRAISKAALSLHRVVSVPPGTYLVSAGVIVFGSALIYDGQLTNYTGVKLVGYGQDVSIIKRASTGTLFDVWVDRVQMTGIHIDGNGAAGVTGSNVRVSASGGRFAFNGGAITDADGWCLEVLADRGTYMQSQGSQYWRYTAGGASESNRPAGACIYLGDDGNVPQYRKFIACDTAPYNDLLDDGGQLTQMIGCSTHNHRMRANAKKSMITGNRLAPHGEHFTVRGIEHVITGNAIGAPTTIENSVNNAVIVGNLHSGDATYPSGINDLSAPGTNVIVGGYTRAGNAASFLRNAGEVRTKLAINPGTVAAGAVYKASGLAFPGAVAGSIVRAAGSVACGLQWWAEVTALSTVDVYARNMTGGNVTPGMMDVTLVAHL